MSSVGAISSSPRVLSAASVVNPTALTATLSTASIGDWFFCVTACAQASATWTISESASWQTLYDAVGTYARFACLARKVDGTEVGPTVTWTGVTTGTSGSPSMVRIINIGPGWLEVDGQLVVDVVGPVSDLAATANVCAGGGALTTTIDDTFCFAHGARVNDAVITGDTDVGGAGVAWTLVSGDALTSGADMSIFFSWGDGPLPHGSVASHTWSVSSAAAVNSSGVMCAIALVDSTPPDVQTDTLLYIPER